MKQFSINPHDASLISIKTKDPTYQAVIGEAKRLSFGDVHLANLAYGCAGEITP